MTTQYSAEALDNKDGWGDFIKVAICNKCVRIATKKNNGEITTPAFAVDGVATLTFNAAAQLGDDVTLYVEVVGDSKQRAYLDKFKVVKSTNTAVSAISAEKNTRSEAYDLLGRKANDNAKGIVIVNGKKVLK